MLDLNSKPMVSFGDDLRTGGARHSGARATTPAVLAPVRCDDGMCHFPNQPGGHTTTTWEPSPLYPHQHTHTFPLSARRVLNQR